MQVSLFSPPESPTHRTPVNIWGLQLKHPILLASSFGIRPLGISFYARTTAHNCLLASAQLQWWAHDKALWNGVQSAYESERVCFWCTWAGLSGGHLHMSGAEASVTCVLSARVISPVSREIQANHVLVYLPSTLLCEITTKRKHDSQTHWHFTIYVHGIYRAHVHETYVYIWNMYTYSNTSFRYLIVDIRHETWRCGTAHIDLSTWIV